MVKWDWNCKIGEVEIVNKALSDAEHEYVSKCSIYSGGNCLAVILYEYKDAKTNEDMYEFTCFFDDMQHVKNCLKGDCFKESLWRMKFFLYDDKACKSNSACKVLNKDMLSMAELFAKAGHEVTLSKNEGGEK